MSDDPGEVNPSTKGKVVSEFRGDDQGKPFVLGFMADTAEDLTARLYEKMLEHWDDEVVRAAFELVLKQRGRGRPRREQSDRHMLDAYKLWSTVPGNNPNNKNAFAKYWFEEKQRGQSVEANRKHLDRVIRRRTQTT